MPNVYVVNRSCHDYSQAKRFGTLIYLTNNSYSRFSTGKMYRRFSEGFKDSSPKDLILISGLTIMSSVACGVFANMHGRLNLLLYNSGPNVTDSYVKRTIIMEGS